MDNGHVNLAAARLMRQCTEMLRKWEWEMHGQPQAALRPNRDSHGSAQPDNALTTPDPVLESELCDLLSEYKIGL
jgi:hypothetical protein